MYFYPKYWVPIFGENVLAGLEVSSWQFKNPIYANDLINANCRIEAIKPTSIKKEVIISWRFSFQNVKNEEVQSMQLKILHKMP